MARAVVRAALAVRVAAPRAAQQEPPDWAGESPAPLPLPQVRCLRSALVVWAARPVTVGTVQVAAAPLARTALVARANRAWEANPEPPAGAAPLMAAVVGVAEAAVAGR